MITLPDHLKEKASRLKVELKPLSMELVEGANQVFQQDNFLSCSKTDLLDTLNSNNSMTMTAVDRIKGIPVAVIVYQWSMNDNQVYSQKIEYLIVSAKYRSKGIGALLLDYALLDFQLSRYKSKKLLETVALSKLINISTLLLEFEREIDTFIGEARALKLAETQPHLITMTRSPLYFSRGFVDKSPGISTHMIKTLPPIQEENKAPSQQRLRRHSIK